MLISEFCSANDSAKKRRYSFNKRKLEVLNFYRDSLERRIAAVSASMETLQQQINRDREEEGLSIN